MSLWSKLKVKAEELLGRAEQVYGESHGDARRGGLGTGHRRQPPMADMGRLGCRKVGSSMP